MFETCRISGSSASGLPALVTQLRQAYAAAGRLRIASERRATTDDGVQNQSGGDAPPIREELVQQLRARIATGQYLTPERIAATVEIMHAELFGR